MNDNAIIKAIRKIHFTIVSFIAFAVTVSIILFVLLQHGLTIERLRLPHITVEQLYIKWNEKLALDANRITITISNRDTDDAFDPDSVSNAMKAAKYLNGWFEHIHLHRLTYGEADATLRYDAEREGNFSFNTPDGNLSGRFSLTQRSLDATLDSVAYKGLQLADNATLRLLLDAGRPG